MSNRWSGSSVITAVAFWSFLGMLLAIYAIGTRSYGFDDSFITYRYADNLRNGYGLTFNPGETHYGSTAMGFAVALAAVSSLLGHAGYGDIPAIARWISALSLLAIVTVVFLIVRAALRPGAIAYVLGVAAGLYVFAARIFRDSVGHETYPFLALLTVGAFLVFFCRRYVAGAICLAVSPLLRPDAALFIGIVVAVLASRQYAWRDVGWRNIAVVAGICGGVGVVWTAFTWSYFGSPIPETMYAKKAQVYLGHWPIFRLLTLGSEARLHLTATLAALILCGLVGSGYWLYRGFRGGSTIEAVHRDSIAWSVAWFVFSAGLVLSYRAFRVTYWFWYLVPIWLALLLGSTAAIVSIARQHPLLGRVLVLAGLLTLVWDGPTAAHGIRRWMLERPVRLHATSYDPIVAFLHREEPLGTVVANAEPGSLGYKLGPRYKVIDELGLASPGVARHIVAGDLDYPFRRWTPDYVIVSFEGSYSPHRRRWFEHAYRPIGEFEHPFWRRMVNRGALLYRRSVDRDTLERLIGGVGK